MLPDNVLLEIFDLYQKFYGNLTWNALKWCLLVHVCQRWRQIVFASPHRLNLRILCTRSTSVRKLLHVWPPLPICLSYMSKSRSNADDAIAALEHGDRVSYVELNVTGPLLEKMEEVMQVPFPVLTQLYIKISQGVVNALPREFLGGSAPSLHTIDLYGVSYPSLPRLLLSANDLVHLRLHKIPPSGYISPEAIVIGLAALPRLKTLLMEFQSASSRPDRIHPPPTTRTVLPSLTLLEFKGASEYLEGLVAQIDTPQLKRIDISYFNQLADFQASQLHQFINRSVALQATLFSHAKVTFRHHAVSFTLSPHSEYNEPVKITIICEGVDWQASHMSQLVNQFSATLSNVVDLNFTNIKPKGRVVEVMDDVEWRDLLHPFSAAKTLHASKNLAEHLSLALEDIEGGIVLPSLDSIRLGGQPASSGRKLLARRRLAAELPAHS